MCTYWFPQPSQLSIFVYSSVTVLVVEQIITHLNIQIKLKTKLYYENWVMSWKVISSHGNVMMLLLFSHSHMYSIFLWISGNPNYEGFIISILVEFFFSFFIFYWICFRWSKKKHSLLSSLWFKKKKANIFDSPGFTVIFSMKP